MSRIGKKPVIIEKGVSCELNNRTIKIKGPKGELLYELPEGIDVDLTKDSVNCKRKNNSKYQKALHGLSRSIIKNNVIGVSKGYNISLEVFGVGYRVQLKGEDLQIQVGYSHPIVILPPKGIKFTVEGTTKITVSGIDKQLVGQIARNIKAIKMPDSYKGKGIRYFGEVIRTKAGKAGVK